MHESDVYAKTAAGVEELKSRGRELSQRLRAMLIMVDGARTVADLRTAAQAVGAPEDFLQTLQDRGLVALARAAPQQVAPAVAVVEETRPAPLTMGNDVERFTTARKLMNDTAVDALGLKAFFFTLKLERCATLQDLRALLPEFKQGLIKTRGESFADRVVDRVRALLG